MKFANLLAAAILLTLPMASFSQAGKSFTLHGQIADPKLDSVSMLYINSDGKVAREKNAVKDGAFEFTGQISQPSMCYILFIHKGEKLNKREVEQHTDKVFIESGDMFLTQEADDQGMVHLKGSKSQEEWNELRTKTKAVQLAINSLTATSTGAGHERATDADPEKLAPLRSKLAKINYDYFVGHPASYVAANQVMFFTAIFSPDSLQYLYNHYTPEIKESMDGRRLAAEIKGRTAGLPGTVAFAFTVKDKDGKDLSLADFKGKYVLLDFWATWCVPCRASMPHMIGLYQKYKNRNFDVIAIGDDDSRVQEWIDAIAHDGTGMFHHTLRGVNSEMTRKGIPNPRDLDEPYGVRALPTLVLIDPDGKIAGRFSGNETDLDLMLTGIFKN